ncbi:MAG: GIY-YIG nuclease family protein [Dehalococcoidia bacterium]|nr:GIY-YIG nuclease family protein [Dehalococcoidia bacterium]
MEAAQGRTSQAMFSSPGGAYALLLHLDRQTHLDVGRLGRFAFPSGYYLYLGSALGGLKARLSRHLRRPKTLRWHIDYLTAHAEVVEIWWHSDREKRECAWAALTLKLPGANVPVPRFGSSDCRCPSHLVRLPARPGADMLEDDNVSTLRLEPLTSPPSGYWRAKPGV